MHIGDLRQRIQKMHQERHSWRAVAAHYGITPAMAHLIGARNYEPRSPAVRERLGLGLPMPTTVVVVVGGEEPLPARAQIVRDVRFCARCGEPFITNHPARRHCFICSRYRGKGRGSNGRNPAVEA